MLFNEDELWQPIWAYCRRSVFDFQAFSGFGSASSYILLGLILEIKWSGRGAHDWEYPHLWVGIHRKNRLSWSGPLILPGQCQEFQKINNQIGCMARPKLDTSGCRGVVSIIVIKGFLVIFKLLWVCMYFSGDTYDCGLFKTCSLSLDLVENTSDDGEKYVHTCRWG